MKYYLLILCFVFTLNLSYSQKPVQQFTILFYNVENLFDTIDDPLKNDQDFLPVSTVSWNSKRYFQKLNHLSKVIISSDTDNYPSLIGIAEAENKKVLLDLVSNTDLKKKKYDIILEEGPDPRGIDVGLMFQKDKFKYLSHKSFRGAESFDGRFILYVKLKNSKDTFHVFVNHWKSRQGGALETAPMRMESALKLKSITDSLFAKNPASNIIIMGDFNDEPVDPSISAGLKALPLERDIRKSSLYNLMYGPLSRGEGTLYYKDWDVFDQIIISGNLLLKKDKGPKVISEEGRIVKNSWMLYKNKEGDMVPSRTAGSREYFGGYSDHLPVFITIMN